MLIRPQRCASGFVLEAHWKSFHSSVQIQWARYVSQVHSVWISCFSSLPANAVRARWRALAVRQPNRVWNGSQRFSSPPNMQCVLSSPYLISSHLICSDRGACVRVLKMHVRLRLHSCLRGGNIMYPISPSFHFASRGQLTELPSTFQLFYWAEMFSLAWRIAENPPNYTCHAAWSCPSWQHGPTKWFTRFLSWMDATPLISQHYEGRGLGGLVLQNNRYWYDIHLSTPLTLPSSCRTLWHENSLAVTRTQSGRG